MKKITILLISAFMAFAYNGWGQTIIDFEVDGDGYTPSAIEGSGYTDVFNRTNPNIGGNSTYMWSVEDINLSDPYITLDQIDVTGSTSFAFSIDMIAHHYNDWDGTDELLITYSLDGGAYQNLMWVQMIPEGDANGATNEPAALDTDFDGDGECAYVLPALSTGTGSQGCAVTSNTFETFTTSAISLSSNTTLDITLQFNNLTSTDEGIYLDNIMITEIGSGNNPPLITGISHTPSSDISSSTTVSVSANVTDTDGTVTGVELHWGTATGSLGNTINMSNAGGDTYTTDSDIPAQSGGTTVYYEVEATDDDTDVSTSAEYSYNVYPYSATLPYSEDFTTGFGQCYTKSALGSTKEWEWNSGGYAYMNGYDSGETEEDWLILPGINLDSYTDELMTFDTWYKYGDGDDATHYLKLFYSTDYPGVGDPTTSTWIELNFTRPSGWETWTNSLVVDLSSVTGSSVFIGFKYHYESDSYRTWEVDNISIYEGSRVNVTFQVDMAEQTVSGDGVHIAGSFENWWNASGIELLDGDLDDVYTTTLSLFSGEEYQFKYLNGNAWGTDETVPTGCQAAGTTNRYEVIGGVDYSLDEVCFNSCEDCGVLNNYDITFQVDMQNENVTGDVNIAGSFNGWSDQAMTNTSGSIWEITLALAETTYHTYKFKNGGSWESFDGPCLASSWGDRYITVPSANTTLDLVCFNSCDACPVADFVIINEVDADDILTDDLEFIELFDGGVGNTNLSGLVVVLFNGSDDASYDPVADLDGNSTDANGYFVIGNALVPNVDLILSNGFLQNGADAVGLFVGDGVDFPDNTPVTTTNLLDALVYDTDDADDAGLLVLLNTGEPQINEGERGNKDEHSNQRIPNGSGGPRNTSTYDQSIPTPGAMNTSINTNWTGIVDDNWDDAGNWDNGVPVSLRDVFIPDVSKAAYPVITSSATCNSLFMAGGSFLDIAPSGDLTVIGTFTNNGTLTIKSDVSGTGSLIENNGVNATVERYYTGGEWHIIGAPVAGAQAGMFTGLFLQNHTESTNLWTDVTDPLTNLTPLQGFALHNSTTATASFSGPLNTGTIGAANNVTRSATGNTRGWNAVSNPFASSIDWDAVTGWTKTNVNDATWRHVNASIWATYAGGVGTPTGTTGNFAPGQGFFVEVTDDGSTVGTLQVGPGARVHSSDPFYKNSIKNMLRVKVSGNTYSDETVIRFLDDATQGYDSKYDAHKLFVTNEEAPQVYSLANNFMAINALPETDLVPLGFHAGINGEYSINAFDINDIPSVWLEDTFTGIFTNLTIDSYSFSYSTTDEASRFVLHFAPLSVEDKFADGINIYSYNNVVYVITPEITTGNIIVYNVLGQEVANAEITDVVNNISLVNGGYYIVQVISDNSVTSKKVYIK